jgi:hypothetical protein
VPAAPLHAAAAGSAEMPAAAAGTAGMPPAEMPEPVWPNRPAALWAWTDWDPPWQAAPWPPPWHQPAQAAAQPANPQGAAQPANPMQPDRPEQPHPGQWEQDTITDRPEQPPPGDGDANAMQVDSAGTWTAVGAVGTATLGPFGNGTWPVQDEPMRPLPQPRANPYGPDDEDS